MTNEEKAYEISQSSQIEDGIWHYATAEIAAIMMAEWKDQQFKEQKAINDAELARLKKAWEKEAEVNHDAAMAYKQGHHDAIDKACKWLKAYDVTFTETPSMLEDFRKVMEE